MKFIKGVITGMVISAGAVAMYAECSMGPDKMMKKGKKMLKKLGVI